MENSIEKKNMEDEIQQLKAKADAVRATAARLEEPELQQRVRYFLTQMDMAIEGGNSSIRFFRNSQIDEAAMAEISKQFKVEHYRAGGRDGWNVVL